MSLKVTVHGASNLPDVDFSGQSDPFVVLSFRGRKQTTPWKRDTLNPTWTSEEATFEWLLGAAPLTFDEILSVKIKDKGKLWISRLLGQVEIPLREAREKRKMKKRVYNLKDDKQSPIMDATITLEVQYVAPGGLTDKLEQSIEEDSDAEINDHNDEVDTEEGKMTDSEKSGRKEDRKLIRRRLTRKWTSKVKDFQIRIQIIEGRYLPGSNIHPLVRVTVAGDRRETSFQHSTNSPVYNKIFTFDFRETSEAELFDETILLEVFNARGLFRFNALLGVFKLDVGYVYERKDHSIIRMWTMLFKPEGTEDKFLNDKTPSPNTKERIPRSAAGYLKITVAVQGPGDKLPVGIDAPSIDDKDDDIESNCLFPVGVQRQSALLVLKVYQVNDLPQMDAGVLMKFKSIFSKLSSWATDEEENGEVVVVEEDQTPVDPYLTFSVGGKEVSTEIRYNSSNPKFKEDLKIPFMFPSMCERLKLQLMDWDQGLGKDENIATAFLSLSSIFGPGGLDAGFLPKFGPCFINFYGSPREYHQTPDKYDYLNKGIGEGAAYRGRALVELKTVPTRGSLARPERQPFAKEDEIHFQPFQKRSSFTLFACFHEATMITATNGPVEFELSIGNKGTKFDESVAHSNTNPCKAVFDGSYYKYLPWGREKPCIWIDCQWEDISFRIEALNILNRMRETLENAVENLKRLNTSGLQSFLENFSKTCENNLNHFQDAIHSQSGQRNSLDNEVHKLRLAELKNLTNDAKKLSSIPPADRSEEAVTAKIKDCIRGIKSMAIEAQLSLPDVILWMISGNKRIAYCRIPAHDLMYLESSNKDACGKFCGKIVELLLKYPGQKEGAGRFKIPALVRLEMWFGLAKHQEQWINRENGEFNIYAETYENEVKKGKQWSPSTSRSWPHFSDVAGNLRLPKESFTKPDGWYFTGGWIEPTKEITTIRYPDENLSEYLDKVFEHETRKYPGGSWEEGKPKYVDLDGNETILPASPPAGWSIVSTTENVDQRGQKCSVGWTTDCNRAVDDQGWEYAPRRSYLEYGPEEKAYHLSRRKLLVRKRRRVPGEQVKRDPTLSDGWEYGRSLQEGFHLEEKSKDRLRRRRLLHKIDHEKKEGSIKYPIFKVLVKGKKEKQSTLCVLPRMFVTYQRPIKCQLWVSLYRARGLLAQDDSGMNDPYVRVAFMNQSKTSKTLPQTLSPIWDQTLIFEEVDIFGSVKELVNCPPSVVMELFDYDKKTDDFLGRCTLKPKVDSGKDDLPQPKLAWRKLRRGEQDGGQILAECELFLTEGVTPPEPPKKLEGFYSVRDGLRPETKPKALEILSWGLRDIKSKKPLRLLKPSVEFECNQKPLLSGEIISDMRKCPNFSSPLIKRETLELPIDDEYSPSLSIVVFDNTMFGKVPIGVHEIKSLKDYEIQFQFDEGKQQGHTGVRRKTEGTKESEDHELFDWWSKYYASKTEAGTSTTKEEASSSGGSEQPDTHTAKYLRKEYDTLTIYPTKLEDVPQFRSFNDFVSTFTLHKGKTKSARDYNTYVGQFKGTVRIFNDPKSHEHSLSRLHLPSRTPFDCVVRVYVVRAIQLLAKDPDGLADPYLRVSLGKKSQGTSNEHIAKTLNPEFGRMFEFRAKIPLVKDLKIQVMDYDHPDTDDIIGETEIDLEQRLLSSYHATCGLPKTYFTSGPFEWRDTLTPFQLLAKHCILTGQEMRLDKGTPEIINIGEVPYSLSDFEKKAPSNPEVGEPSQRLALHVLNTCGLVPEHVETRPLFSKVQPDIEQGKLEMWVDIFTDEVDEVVKHDPSRMNVNQMDGTQLFSIVKRPFISKEGKTKTETTETYPVDELLKAPVSIDPREPVKYELRVIIWNTADVKLDDKSIFGEKMSDIFVKAWLVGLEKDQQYTSVHERSLDGNGSFNWRMIFPLEYLPFEKKIVLKEKVHHLSRDVKKEKKPPLLKLQIFDKDRLSSSDLIGDLELNLSKLIRPCLHPSRCGTDKDPRIIAGKKLAWKDQFIDLFFTQRKTGWWACYGEEKKDTITGKVEMTLEILEEEEAKAKPAGLGQSSPNQYPVLDKPVRPAHSFLWYTSPFKTLKYIIWRNINKCYLLKVLFFIFLALLIFLFVYSIPNYAAKKVVGA